MISFFHWMDVSNNTGLLLWTSSSDTSQPELILNSSQWSTISTTSPMPFPIAYASTDIAGAAEFAVPLTSQQSISPLRYVIVPLFVITKHMVSANLFNLIG
jgi:hypothetical protein